MRDAEQTVGNLIDKQKVAYIASVHDDGFPNIKAMLSPRKREGIKRSIFLLIHPLCGLSNTNKMLKPAFIFVISGFTAALCLQV